jgi:hypothetical protein
VIGVRFSPLATWPHGHTRDRRSRWAFKASWSNTLELLDRELRLLDATDVIIGVHLQPQHIRLDGWPRGNAPEPSHPGVEISFTSGAIARLDPTVRRGRELIRRAGGDAKAALRRAHPDTGGDHADFVAIQAATDPAKRLVYATDVCAFWQHNIRSIALGLEALRAVDRYGISRRGEQYAGFRAALTSGREAA